MIISGEFDMFISRFCTAIIGLIILTPLFAEESH